MEISNLNNKKFYYLVILILSVYIYYNYYQISINEGFKSQELTHQNPNYQFIGNNLPLYTLRQNKIIDLPKLGSYHRETVYYKVGEMIRSLYPLNHLSIEGGSIDAIEKLRNGKLDIVMVQENIFNDAILGNGFFKNKPLKNTSMITGLFYDTFMLITYQNSGLIGWKDLRGHKIGLPSKNTATHQNFIKLVQCVGLDPDKDMIYINVESPNRLANLLLKKEIDGIFLTSNSKNPYLINLARKMSLRFIGTDEINDDIINLYFPLAHKKVISTTNFYNNINTSALINTYGIREILVARDDVNSKIIYDLIKKIYQNVENLKFGINNFLGTQHRNNELIDAFIPSEMSFIEDTIPIHNGAKNYYIEQGWIKIEKKITEKKITN
jgi:TRAP transporter TAXI family solute receptor